MKSGAFLKINDETHDVSRMTVEELKEVLVQNSIEFE